MHQTLTKLALILFLCASTTYAQKTSTPEERQQWAATLHQLEASPSDPKLIARSETVVMRLIEVDDFHMKLCSTLLEIPSDYSSKQPMLQLFMMGLAAYQVETGKTDDADSNLYALHSVLKGYANLVAQNPAAKNKRLDELAKMDAEDKLPNLIGKKKCA